MRERRYSAAERYRLRTGRDVEMESTKGVPAIGEARRARPAFGSTKLVRVVGMCFAEGGIAYGSTRAGGR